MVLRIQHFLAFGIRNPVPAGIRNPTRGIRNPTSSITMESRSGMYYTFSSNYITNHHLSPPLGIPYHHHHQKVFGHLKPTLSMSPAISPLLAIITAAGLFLTGHKFKIIFLSWRLSELFRPWPRHCLLNGQHRPQLFSAGVAAVICLAIAVLCIWLIVSQQRKNRWLLVNQ